MNKQFHDSISIKKSTTEVSHKDAITSTESRPTLGDEPPAATNSTYESFYWLYNYTRLCTSRLTYDLYASFINYWYPNRELLPPHIADLMQVQHRLRAERESHTVTYSREQPGDTFSQLSVRNFYNAFKSYVLSSEDDAVVHFTSKKYDYLGNDREQMFVIVDSSCDSNPSSKELLIDTRLHTRDAVKRHFNKHVNPVDVPSTSRDLRNEILSPLQESDSFDEMLMMDINLQSDNELLIDSDCDNDSIVISYLKNKDAFLDFEGTLMSTKKKSSLLESVPKMETILESEQFNAFPMTSKSDSPSVHFMKNDTSASSLDILIPSIQSDESLQLKTTTSDPAIEEDNNKYKKAIEFLHHDNEFLIAAEVGDERMLRLLIDRGADVHDTDHMGRNALHLAVVSGNRLAVALLLSVGVKPNIKDNVGMTPLSLCLMRRPSWRMASLLIDHGAKIMPRGTERMDTGLFLQFVMMCTPTREEAKILRLLVEKGALVNDPDAPGGRQALHFAAMSNNTDLINILVDLGANLFDVNHRNETPKQVAATFGCKQAFELLQQLEGLASSDNMLESNSQEGQSKAESSKTHHVTINSLD